MATTTLQAGKLTPTITANDVQKSLSFYEGLGFAVTERMEEDGQLMGVMLEAGKATLGISQDDFSKGRDRVKGVGTRLYVETDQDLAALAEKVKSAGITLDGGPAPLPWGPMAFSATDPDGFKLTILNPERPA